MTDRSKPAPSACEHEFEAINQWQTVCRKCGVDLDSLSEPPGSDLNEGVVERAFKEAYRLGFLEAYPIFARNELADDEDVREALMQCEGVSEAWSDYAAAIRDQAFKEAADELGGQLEQAIFEYQREAGLAAEDAAADAGGMAERFKPIIVRALKSTGGES